MKRIDLLLLEKQLAPSRSKAQELIDSKVVFVVVGDKKILVQKVSEKFPEDVEISVDKNEVLQFVSRGGLKLLNALKFFKLDVAGLVVLDVGISTGGFADCLLQNGAQKVFGIDVGRGQLSEKLKNDPRLQFLDGINARDLSKNQEFKNLAPASGFDLCVGDVSFISLSLILPELISFVKARGLFLLLIKPQFELSAGDLDSRGVVKDPANVQLALDKLQNAAKNLGLQVIGSTLAEPSGRDGNREFFLYCRKA